MKGFRYFADTAYRYSVLGSSDEVQPEVLVPHSLQISARRKPYNDRLVRRARSQGHRSREPFHSRFDLRAGRNDFEMTRMEEMFEYYDIPVFRLETDYQDHDIEQLRIRLEAFREMLSQARYSSGSNAV